MSGVRLPQLAGNAAGPPQKSVAASAGTSRSCPRPRREATSEVPCRSSALRPAWWALDEPHPLAICAHDRVTIRDLRNASERRRPRASQHQRQPDGQQAEHDTSGPAHDRSPRERSRLSASLADASSTAATAGSAPRACSRTLLGRQGCRADGESAPVRSFSGECPGVSAHLHDAASSDCGRRFVRGINASRLHRSTASGTNATLENLQAAPFICGASSIPPRVRQAGRW